MKLCPAQKDQTQKKKDRISATVIMKSKRRIMNRVGFEPTQDKPMRIHDSLYYQKLSLESHAITTRPSVQNDLPLPMSEYILTYDYKSLEIWISYAVQTGEACFCSSKPAMAILQVLRCFKLSVDL